MDEKLYQRGRDGAGLLLHELLEELENDDDLGISCITIDPPFEKDGIESCEDSDVSDIESTGNLNHLPSRILLSKCTTNKSSENTGLDRNTAAGTSRELSESDDDIPLSELARKRQKMYKTTNKNKRKKQMYKTTNKNKRKKQLDVDEHKIRTWDENHTTFAVPEFVPLYPTTEVFLKNTLTKPVDAFFSFFSKKLLQVVTTQTNLYAAQKGNHNLQVTENEIKVVIGVLLLSGYHTLPGRRMYWKKDADCYCPLVANAIRRNRFDDILRYLHLADNSAIDQTDRFYKVRPIFDHMNDSFKQFSVEENYSIDESIIPYFGRHGAKQFIRGKPIRFGYKLWCLANPAGFLYHVEPYCGSSTRLPQTSYGQGGNVVLGLAKHAELPQGSKMYFDNLFTSVGLLDNLTSLGYGGTGTLRKNRVPKEAHLSENNLFAKTNRGTIEHKTDGNLVLVRWNDNAVVTVLSNCIPMDPLKTVERYSRADKKKIHIQMPRPIAAYNKNMGGVDLNDQFLSTYRISIRTKKWWWPFFSWSVDESCVQAWLLWRRCGSSNIPLLEFRRQIALYLLATYGQPSLKPGPSSSQLSPVVNQLRLNEQTHLIVKGSGTWRRCKSCSKRTSFECNTCKVALHPKTCFENFHKK